MTLYGSMILLPRNPFAAGVLLKCRVRCALDGVALGRKAFIVVILDDAAPARTAARTRVRAWDLQLSQAILVMERRETDLDAWNTQEERAGESFTSWPGHDTMDPSLAKKFHAARQNIGTR